MAELLLGEFKMHDCPRVILRFRALRHRPGRPWSTCPMVTGTFQGASDGNITKFLGVPFARPTRRFELPQPPLHLLGIQNATAFGLACPQQALSPVPIAMPNYSHTSEAFVSYFIP
ncbi:hypothetical protein DFH06DRAFT_1238100 [Mycena polygramma]|nr:hypothetical protein DFH06DRAFT_1241388 [Mycena polygramma]KAJ7616914.1 hypothetical protein DFH06DRAFT_1238100 [Mycena polygramma]